MLGLDRPSLDGEQVEAIVTDVLAVVSGSTELSELPDEVAQACLAREALESIVHTRP